jgi:molybdate transport system regulatory protein
LIAAAGRHINMSYRRTWLLVDDLNHLFRAPLVASQIGGLRGGGAALTDLGRSVTGHYRAIEAAAQTAGRSHIAALAVALTEMPPAASRIILKKASPLAVKRRIALFSKDLCRGVGL